MTRDSSAPKPCPICPKPRKAEHAPFCSARCRDRDLMQWLSDGYALPGSGEREEDDHPLRDAED
jgi:endogenous inhibitor of DNA gyrase (YacG/DUF329 family)